MSHVSCMVWIVTHASGIGTGRVMEVRLAVLEGLHCRQMAAMERHYRGQIRR